MSAEPASQPHLVPVPDAPAPGEKLFVLDQVTGNMQPLGEYLQPFEDHISGLQRAVKSENLRYENLKRDKEKEAKAHPLWPQAMEVFGHWKKVCKHPRSSWSPERFEQVRPFLEKHGVELCKRACDGAAFDPFVTQRKNGSKKRHDGWGLVFRAAEPEKFEEFVNKAPIKGAS